MGILTHVWLEFDNLNSSRHIQLYDEYGCPANFEYTRQKFVKLTSWWQVGGELSQKGRLIGRTQNDYLKSPIWLF